MNVEHRNTLVLEVSKVLITLNTGLLGLLLAGAKTLSGDNVDFSSLSIPAIWLIASIVFALLAILGLIDRTEEVTPKFKLATDKWMIVFSWGAFIIALAWGSLAVL
ncbi:hypothetical protein L3Q72_06775 [Vibrio sp. JC009]|uniref:hypothetical protein n=1 Tax=Vibrio sp. JC009 TaxID=2912314 RepID=UPI0023AE7358|nr:hypothetical protein [Vibrio sp. JC009]WED23092.1 hypothetical protein L3Q72_06775 [Vibrio sp. JC009]